MVKVQTTGGKGNEPWYKSRRIWSGVLAGTSAILIQFGYVDIATGLTTIAGAFGITSWIVVKK